MFSKIGLLTVCYTLAILLAANANNSACTALDGATVLNDDNEFIGTISSPFTPDSIFNKFGVYGSQFGVDSIWNKFGDNGSEFSPNSAFNKFSVNPPRIIKNRSIIGFLTENSTIAGGISPVLLGAVCYDFKRPR